MKAITVLAGASQGVKKPAAPFKTKSLPLLSEASYGMNTLAYGFTRHSIWQKPAPERISQGPALERFYQGIAAVPKNQSLFLGAVQTRSCVFGLILFLLLAAGTAYGAQDIHTARKTDEPEVIERTIKVEGSIEKPRVIFIIPRARLWKNTIDRKSFISDILKPVYPEQLINESVLSNTPRR